MLVFIYFLWKAVPCVWHVKVCGKLQIFIYMCITCDVTIFHYLLYCLLLHVESSVGIKTLENYWLAHERTCAIYSACTCYEIFQSSSFSSDAENFWYCWEKETFFAVSPQAMCTSDFFQMIKANTIAYRHYIKWNRKCSHCVKSEFKWTKISLARRAI